MAVTIQHLLVFCTFLLNAASSTAVRAPGAAANLTCTGNFTLHEMACYSYAGSEIRRSFRQAERHCSRLKASLASLLGPGEEAFVRQLVDNDTSFWIGLTDQGSGREGAFVWTDGAALTHASWRDGEPSLASHLHCAMADSEGWALAKGGCASTRLPFVCKKRACPADLEWSGTECTLIISTPLLSLISCFHPLVCLAVACLLCTLLLASLCHHWRQSSSGHNLHHCKHKHSPELWLT